STTRFAPSSNNPRSRCGSAHLTSLNPCARSSTARLQRILHSAGKARARCVTRCSTPCNYAYLGCLHKSVENEEIRGIIRLEERLIYEIDLEGPHTIFAGCDPRSHLQRHRDQREDSVQPTAPRRFWSNRLRQALQEVQRGCQ